VAEEESNFSEEATDKSATVSEEDIAALKQSLTEEKAKAEKHLAGWQRAEADLSNLKKRFDQERSEIITFGNSILLKKLIPVLDDLERAFAMLPPKFAGNNWVNGLDLVYKKLQDILKSEEVTEIEAVGKPFDPSQHDASSAENGPEGVVISVVQKGYIHKGKVLRAAMVTVGNGIIG
jgi:molecular chaperone GrpE